ncbi:MAG: type II secretion system F family protein [Acidimicrobiia bacterium]
MRLLAAATSALALALIVGRLSGGWPVAKRNVVAKSSHDSWLQQTGLGISRQQYLLLSAGVGMGGFLLVWSITGLPAIAIPTAAVLAVLPRAWLTRRRSQRLLRMQLAWPDGIRDLIASISSGMSLGRALETLAVTGPEPLQKAFARYPYLARVMGVSPALEVIRHELAHPASDRVIEVLIVAQAKGGPIVLEILRDLAAATTKDMWAYEEIETLSLEQKINARVVFVIPWLVLGFITLRPGPFRDFYASPSGWLVVASGALASFLGMAIASRLGRQLDEPRVFTGTNR